MKKVNLLAAAVLAAAFAMPAQADYTPNVNFNGYFRSGVFHGEGGRLTGFEKNKVGRRYRWCDHSYRSQHLHAYNH